jgi:hypothetical protein
VVSVAVTGNVKDAVIPCKSGKFIVPPLFNDTLFAGVGAIGFTAGAGVGAAADELIAYTAK